MVSISLLYIFAFHMLERNILGACAKGKSFSILYVKNERISAKKRIAMGIKRF